MTTPRPWRQIRRLLRRGWERGERRYGSVEAKPREFRRRALRAAVGVRLKEIAFGPPRALPDVLASLYLEDLYLVAAFEAGCVRAYEAMSRMLDESVLADLRRDGASDAEVAAARQQVLGTFVPSSSAGGECAG